MEQWKVINEYNNYSVSSYGNVKNNKTGRVLKYRVTKNGYRITNLSTKTVYIHRLVAEHFIDEPSDELKLWASGTVHNKVLVNHKDGNKENNYYKNLEWSTSSNNISHAIDNGLLNNIGEDNYNSKLSDEDIKFIRENYIARSKTVGSKALARKFNVTQQAISCITCNKSWKHIK